MLGMMKRMRQDNCIRPESWNPQRSLVPAFPNPYRSFGSENPPLFFMNPPILRNKREEIRGPLFRRMRETWGAKFISLEASRVGINVASNFNKNLF